MAMVFNFVYLIERLGFEERDLRKLNIRNEEKLARAQPKACSYIFCTESVQMERSAAPSIGMHLYGTWRPTAFPTCWLVLINENAGLSWLGVYLNAIGQSRASCLANVPDDKDDRQHRRCCTR